MGPTDATPVSDSLQWLFVLVIMFLVLVSLAREVAHARQERRQRQRYEAWHSEHDSEHDQPRIIDEGDREGNLTDEDKQRLTQFAAAYWERENLDYLPYQSPGGPTNNVDL
jgi:flagellar biosynthesis/type III secretory pathway M-ring protein FliF/YscJ